MRAAWAGPAPSQPDTLVPWQGSPSCLSVQQRSQIKAVHALLSGAQVGSLIDMHQYVGPNAPLPTLTRAAVLGEFGGLGLRLEGHQLVPEDSFSYQEMHSPAELEVRP